MWAGEEDKGHSKIIRKKAVIVAYLEIKEKKEHGIMPERCIFIVDRDYGQELDFGQNNLSDEDKRNLVVTTHHSIESYYMTDQNLEIIFGRLGRNDVHFFKNQIAAFAKETIAYFILCSIPSIRYGEDNWPKINTKPRPGQINNSEDSLFWFNKNPNGGLTYARDSVAFEIKRLERVISNNSCAYDIYLQLKNKYEGTPQNIKGHIAFKYLREYLSTHSGEDNGDAKNWGYRIRSQRMTNRLSIDMIFVNGKGEPIQIYGN